MKFVARLKTLVSRVPSLARRVVDPIPCTPLGLAVLIGAGCALYFLGVKHVDLVVLAMSGVALAVAVLSTLAVSLTALALKLSLRRSLAKESGTLPLECGFPSRVGFSVSSLWWVPFVSVSWKWLSPLASVRTVRERRRLFEESTPARRGLYDNVVRRVEIQDPFGLARCAFRVTDPRAVRALPSVGALKRVEVVRTLAPGEDISNPKGGPDGERADMRAYAPGDPIKFVLWKVFARTGNLVLRAPERAFSPAKQTTAYLVTGVSDEAAAGVARLLVETNSLGSKWVLGADGSDDDARGPQQAMELIARSGSTKPEDGALGLGGFLKRHATSGGRIVVIVPAMPGPWLDRARAAVAAAGSSAVEFIVCTDGVTANESRSKLAKLLMDEPSRSETDGDPLPTQEQLRVVCATLATQRGSVMIVDRRAGRVYGDAHRRALEAA
ncbi:MAG: DUF58 domain-containing protein [Myxococcales bacterium]|nr:DUF58 domain-containing protein [Myxococcales bacterium]